MTEIPEHLLKRSRERRQALGLSTRGRRGGARCSGGFGRRAGHDHACRRRRLRPLGPPRRHRPRHRRPSRSRRTSQAAQAPPQDPDLGHARARRSCRCGPSSTPRPCGRQEVELTGALAEGEEVYAAVLLVPRRAGPGWRGLPVRRRRGDQDLPQHRGAGRLRVHAAARSSTARSTATRTARAARTSAWRAATGRCRPSATQLTAAELSAWCATSATASAAATRPATSSSSTAPPTLPKFSRGRGGRRLRYGRVKPRFEVLVVGGGPAGAATGYWLAQHGHDVLVVEKKALPAREDLRRRPDAAGRQPARRHGPERAAQPVPPLRRAAGHRPRQDARAAPGRSTRSTPPTATWCAGASSTSSWSTTP